MSSTAIPRVKTDVSRCFRQTFNDPNMPTFAVGDRVKFGSSDTLLAAVTGGDDLSFGYVHEQNGKAVTVNMDGTGIIPVKIVTSGTATRGGYAVMSATANQYQDAPDGSGGTTAVILAGRFMNAGTDEDIVGMMIGGINLRGVT